MANERQRIIWQTRRAAVPTRPGGAKLEGGIKPPDGVAFDPYYFPPSGSQQFNLRAAQAIVGAATTYAPAGLVQALPHNMVGVIHTIGLQLDGIALTTNVTWSIQTNGIPIPGFGAIAIPGISGVAAAVREWPVVRIAVPVEGIIGVVITNFDGGSYTATTTLYGWWWPVNR